MNIYEVSLGDNYTFVIGEDNPRFPKAQGWRYFKLASFENEQDARGYLRQIYLSEKDNYLFIDYL